MDCGQSTNKPCSPALSQYDYYQHDQDESLNTMTVSTGMPPARCSSSPSCSIVSTQGSTSTGFFGGTPTEVSRDGKFHRMRISDEGSGSRIPRRVKSTPTAGGSGAAGISYSSSNTSLIGGSSIGTPKMRSNFTSSAVSTVSSVVSSCLLATANIGGGDGVSLDPEVDLWLDMIPLSRKPFKNFHRDFADGVMMAEIMAHFFPKRVDLHNYVPASACSAKKANYDTLNHKVFTKMGVRLADNLIDGIIQAKPGYIEKALRQVHRLIDNTDRKYVETRAKELSALAGSYDGSSYLQSPFVEELCLVRNIPGEIPDCVIYQNIKYYPSITFEEMSKSEEQLREKNNELCNKVRRLETQLNLKENHLQDLTSKIHELRAKYESSQQERQEEF